MPGSYLQQWMQETRAFRFGEMGRQACKILIDEVDQVVNFSNENVKVEVLRQESNRYVARELRQLEAQAFNGKPFAERDRCWRCRLTFGFTWMSAEADPAKTANENVLDYEGRWDERLSESGNLLVEVECGECAEYCTCCGLNSRPKQFHCRKKRLISTRPLMSPLIPSKTKTSGWSK